MALRIAIAILFLLGLSGCNSSSPRHGAPSSFTNNAITSASVAPVPEDIQGSWSGQYYCEQGLTQVNIQIRPRGPSEATGLFQFGPPSGRRGARGAFHVRIVGTTGGIELVPERWERKPNNYEMVGAVLYFETVNFYNRMSGFIKHPNCGDISVVKDALVPPNQKNAPSVRTAELDQNHTPTPAKQKPSGEAATIIKEIEENIEKLRNNKNSTEAAKIIIERIIYADSKKWMFNKYDRGSISNVSINRVTSPNAVSFEKDQVDIYGEYIYNASQKGWAKLRLINGEPSCLVYWDNDIVCKPIGMSTAASGIYGGMIRDIMKK